MKKKEDNNNFFISLFSLLYMRKIFMGQKIYHLDLVENPGKFVYLEKSNKESILFEKSHVVLN